MRSDTVKWQTSCHSDSWSGFVFCAMNGLDESERRWPQLSRSSIAPVAAERDLRQSTAVESARPFQLRISYEGLGGRFTLSALTMRGRDNPKTTVHFLLLERVRGVKCLPVLALRVRSARATSLL
jgi:hypothetical protein